MKKKLDLHKLSVTSFITNKEKSSLQGGAEETKPAGCGQQTYTCPTFGYGDCTNFWQPCVG